MKIKTSFFVVPRVFSVIQIKRPTRRNTNTKKMLGKEREIALGKKTFWRRSRLLLFFTFFRTHYFLYGFRRRSRRQKAACQSVSLSFSLSFSLFSSCSQPKFRFFALNLFFLLFPQMFSVSLLSLSSWHTRAQKPSIE